MSSTSPMLAPEVQALNIVAELQALVDRNMIPARGFLNLTQAALYLGMSPGTLREWIRTKRLPHYKPGKELFFKRAELDQWMDRHRTVAGPIEGGTPWKRSPSLSRSGAG